MILFSRIWNGLLKMFAFGNKHALFDAVTVCAL